MKRLTQGRIIRWLGIVSALCAVPVGASATLYDGPYFYEYVSGNADFYDAEATISPPSFGTIPPGSNIAGVFFGYQLETGGDTITAGWTQGNYSGLETYQGGFFEDEYESNNTDHVALYTHQSGTQPVVFEVKSGTSVGEHDGYIAGTLVADNMPGTNSFFDFMQAGIGEYSTSGGTAAIFPSFNSPVEETNLGTATTDGGAFTPWKSDTIDEYQDPPASEATAKITYTAATSTVYVYH